MRIFLILFPVAFLSACSEYRVAPKDYSIAFDEPPHGLTWDGNVIEHKAILKGNNVILMQKAIEADASGNMSMYGTPFLVEKTPYKMPRRYTIRYYSDGMTNVPGDVLVFSWPRDIEELDGEKIVPAWLDLKSMDLVDNKDAQ